MQGIYKIENVKNGKVYVGRSKHIEKRWKQHMDMLEKNEHHSIKLQRAYNKLKDKDTLQFSVIEEVEDESKLAEREQYWTDYYDAYHSGYGCTGVVDNPKYALKNQKRAKKKEQLKSEYETFDYYYNKYKNKLDLTWSFTNRIESKYYKNHVVHQLNEVLVYCERYLEHDGISLEIRPYRGGYNHLYVTLYNADKVMIEGEWGNIKNDQMFMSVSFSNDTD